MTLDLAERGEYRAARACVMLFVLSTFISYAYVFGTGTYNGDFYGAPEKLGFFGQTCVLIAALIPYVFGWYLYRYFKSKNQRRTVRVPYQSVACVFFIVVIWFIAIAMKYDVGVIGRDAYVAPPFIKFIIQISNRINPFYIGVFFILTNRESRKTLWLGIVLLLALGMLRASLGVFLYVALALLIRNYREIASCVRRNKMKVLIASLLFPLIVSQLYSVRGTLRGDRPAGSSPPISEVVVGKLAGRLSSFSDSALIFQKSGYFESAVNRLDDLYFFKQAFGGIFGAEFIPEVTPERMLVNVSGGDYVNVSFMTGLPGNLYLAWLLSPAVFILNLSLVLLMCLAIFILARKLRTPLANEFALVLVLYPLTSGVGNEFSSVIISLLSFLLIFLLLTIFNKKNRKVASNFS